MDNMMLNEDGEELAIVDESSLTIGELSSIEQQQQQQSDNTNRIYVNQLHSDDADYAMVDNNNEIANSEGDSSADEDYNDDLGEEDSELDLANQASVTPLTSKTTTNSNQNNVQEEAYAYIDQLQSPGVEPKMDTELACTFSCQLCPYQSDQEANVAEHVQSCHFNQPLFRCSKCAFVCQKKIEYCVHKATHQAGKLLRRCRECSYQTCIQRNFDRHLTRHRVPGPVQCALCSYSSTGEAAIQRHMTEYHHHDASSSSSSSTTAAAPGAKVGVSNNLPPGINAVRPDPASKPSTSRRLMKILKSSPASQLQHSGSNAVCSPASSPLSSSSSCSPAACSLGLPASSSSSSVKEPANKSGTNTLSSLLREPLVQRRPLSRADIDALTCSVCYVVLASEARLQGHMTGHADIAPHCCPVCPMRYVDKTGLSEHLSKVHKLITREDDSPSSSAKPLSETNSNQSMPIISADENGVFKCSQCRFKVKSAAEMRKHLLDHSASKKFKCRYCNDRYCSHLELNQHLRSKHDINIPTVKSSDNILNGSQDKITLDNGVRMVSPVMSVISLTAVPPGNNSGPSNGPSNNNNNNGNAAAASAAVVRNVNMIKCPKCPYVGQYRAEVARHMLMHTGKKQWSCNFCVYKTYWKGDMKRHLQRHHAALIAESGNDIFEILENTKIHHNHEEQDSPTPDSDKSQTFFAVDSTLNKDIRCPLCSFTCNTADQLSSHMPAHGDLRRYACDACGHRCNYVWMTRKHIRAAHPGQPSVKVVALSEKSAADTLASYLASEAAGDQSDPVTSAVNASSAAAAGLDNVDVAGGLVASSSATSPSRRPATSATIGGGRSSPSSAREVAASSSPIPGDAATSPATPGSPSAAAADHHLVADDDGQRSNAAHFDDDDDEDDYVIDEGDCEDDGEDEEEEEGGEYSNGIRTTAYHLADDPADATPVTSPTSSDPNDPANQATLLPDGASPGNFTSRCRPFKCSLCGRRSNWKWDVTKHIKSVHNNDPKAKILVLPESVAMATLHTVVPFGKAINNNNNNNNAGNHSNNDDSNQDSPSVTPNSSALKRKVNMPTSKPRTNKDRNRPFKCSQCGLRSNWKWDVTKHIRMFHANMEPLPDLIILDPETASNTPYTPPIYNSAKREAIASTAMSVAASPNAMKEVVKDPRSVAAVPLLNRRFRCEICLNKANYRSDIVRHVKRVHKVLDPDIINLSVVDLMNTLTTEEIVAMKAEETPPKRFFKGGSSTQSAGDFTQFASSPVASTTTLPPGGVYRCSRCDFEDKCKSFVVQHYAVHAPGAAYQCCLCGDRSDYRNSIYRHIRNRHRRSDYNSIIIEAAIRQPGADVIVDPPAAVVTPATDTPTSAAAAHHPQKGGRKPAALKLTTDAGLVGTRLYRCGACEYTARDPADVQRHAARDHTGHAHTTAIGHAHSVDAAALPSSPPSTPATTTATAAADKSRGALKRKPSDAEFQAQCKKKQMVCDLCPYHTRSKVEFMSHSNSHYPQEGMAYKCSHCDFYTPDQKSMDQHEQLHTTGIFMCKLCPYKTDRKQALLGHAQYHRRRVSAVYKCSYCEFWLSDKKKLGVHMRLHIRYSKDSTEPPTKRQKLRAVKPEPGIEADENHHQEAKTGNEPTKLVRAHNDVEVGEDDPKTSGQDLAVSVKSKPATRKIHRCRSCPYRNLKATRLRAHERMHGFRDKGVVAKSGRPLLKCVYCNYYAGNKGLIIHHQKVHSPSYKPDIDEEPLNESLNDDISSPSTLIQFTSDITLKDTPGNLCSPTPGKPSSTLNDDDNEEDDAADAGFKQDQKQEDVKQVEEQTMKKIYHVHKSFSQNVLKCDRCPYGTNVKHVFNQHAYNHGREKKYKCSLCDYSDDIADAIHDHILLHKDSKNINVKNEPQELDADLAFMCTKCPFQADLRPALTAHLARHRHLSSSATSTATSQPAPPAQHASHNCCFCSYSASGSEDLGVHLQLHVDSITKAMNRGGQIIVEKNTPMIRNQFGVKINMFGD